MPIRRKNMLPGLDEFMRSRHPEMFRESGEPTKRRIHANHPELRAALPQANPVNVDGRSNPRLKPCPPGWQKYVLRRCIKGFPVVARWAEDGQPFEFTTEFIERDLHSIGIHEGTYTLSSIRPRMRHMATYRFVRQRMPLLGNMMRLVRIDN